jgi:predicted TIM-barrel fold metal-dependent hydrolase
MIIDCHHHLGKGPDYAKKLANECARLKIDKVCLMGLPDYVEVSTNAQIKEAMNRYPDLLFGFAFADLRTIIPDDINRFKDEGFRGLKFIRPPSNYDDEKFDRIYQQAEKLRMPALFHLGIVSRNEQAGPYRINSNYMRPIYLDTIARIFPHLTVIGAHLGNPWYEEATMAARWNPNLYFDLSGSTLKKKTPEFLGSLLWWTPTTRYRDPEGRYAWEKILFGSDVPYNEIEEVMTDYKKALDALKIDKKIQGEIFGGTMAKILGLEG